MTSHLGILQGALLALREMAHRRLSMAQLLPQSCILLTELAGVLQAAHHCQAAAVLSLACDCLSHEVCGTEAIMAQQVLSACGMPSLSIVEGISEWLHAEQAVLQQQLCRHPALRTRALLILLLAVPNHAMLCSLPEHCRPQRRQPEHSSNSRRLGSTCSSSAASLL